MSVFRCFFKVSEDKVYDTIEFNEFLQVTIARRGLPSLFLFSNVRKVFFQMISKQRATSVGFDDLVDAFRFECRVQ